MAGRRILADTSLFIDHMRTRGKPSTHLSRLALVGKIETSAIVAAELHYGVRNLVALERAIAVLAPVPVHPFTSQMAERTGDIVRRLRAINRIQDTRDVMIAAATLELQLPISTLNRAHFEPIPGLELVDPA